MGTPGAYGAHSETAKHLGCLLQIDKCFLESHPSLDLAKYRLLQIEYGNFSICPAVFFLCRYNDSNMCMSEGDVSVPHGVLPPHLLGEVSRISFQDKGVNIKAQVFIVILFKVCWIRSPAHCQLSHLNVFTLALPLLMKSI